MAQVLVTLLQGSLKFHRLLKQINVNHPFLLSQQYFQTGQVKLEYLEARKLVLTKPL